MHNDTNHNLLETLIKIATCIAKNIATPFLVITTTILFAITAYKLDTSAKETNNWHTDNRVFYDGFIMTMVPNIITMTDGNGQEFKVSITNNGLPAPILFNENGRVITYPKIVYNNEQYILRFEDNYLTGYALDPQMPGSEPIFSTDETNMLILFDEYKTQAEAILSTIKN